MPFLPGWGEQLWLAYAALGALIIQSLGIMEVSWFGGALTLSSIVGAAVVGAVMIGIMLLMGQDPPKMDYQATRQPMPERQFILGGPVRAPPAYMAYEENNNLSVDVLEFAGHKICGVRFFFLHDDYVTVADEGTGFITATPEYSDGRYLGNIVRIFYRLGLASQTAYSQVISALPTGVWTADHRGDGIADMALLCKGVAREDLTKRYPYLLPQPSPVVDGAALWDPRDEAQDPDDPDTWVAYDEWDEEETYDEGDRVLFRGVPYYCREDGTTGTPPWEFQTTAPAGGRTGTMLIVEHHEEWCSVINNPVLQWLHYELNDDYGEGYDRATTFPPARIAHLIGEANLCDELVTKANGDKVPRYRNMMFGKFPDKPESTKAKILASCDGWTSETGDGSLILWVGVYREPPPDLTIKAKHIISAIVREGTPDEENINVMPLSFTSPAHKFKEVPGQPWRDEANIGATGKERSSPLALTNVQEHLQVRMLAKRAENRARAPRFGRFVLRLYGLRVLGWRWVRIEYPFWPGMSSCVVEVQPDPDPEVDLQAGTVSIEWRQINPNTIDAFDPATEEGTPPPFLEGTNAGILPVPQNLEGEAIAGPPSRIELSWDEIIGRDELRYAIRYRLADDGSGEPGPWTTTTPQSLSVSAGRIHFSLAVETLGTEYIVQVASVGTTGAFSDWSQAEQVDPDMAVPVFQCQLARVDATTLKLAPFAGNRIFVNEAQRVLPAAGITITNGGLSNSTLYYAYAYNNAGTLTLELSATAYATDAANGHKVKSGDATRTLVGMIRTNGSGQFVDAPAQRFVRSLYNEPDVGTFATFTASRSTTSTSFAEVNSEIRNEVLLWAGERWALDLTGVMWQSTATAWVGCSIGVDGATPEPSGAYSTSPANNAFSPSGVTALKSGLSEGYHYATMLGIVGSNTGNYGGASDGLRCALRGLVRR